MPPKNIPRIRLCIGYSATSSYLLNYFILITPRIIAVNHILRYTFKTPQLSLLFVLVSSTIPSISFIVQCLNAHANTFNLLYRTKQNPLYNTSIIFQHISLSIPFPGPFSNDTFNFSTQSTNCTYAEDLTVKRDIVCLRIKFSSHFPGRTKNPLQSCKLTTF